MRQPHVDLVHLRVGTRRQAHEPGHGFDDRRGDGDDAACRDAYQDLFYPLRPALSGRSFERGPDGFLKVFEADGELGVLLQPVSELNGTRPLGMIAVGEVPCFDEAQEYAVLMVEGRTAEVLRRHVVMDRARQTFRILDVRCVDGRNTIVQPSAQDSLPEVRILWGAVVGRWRYPQLVITSRLTATTV